MVRMSKLFIVVLMLCVALPAFAQITPKKSKAKKAATPAEATRVEEKKTVHHAVRHEPSTMTPQFPERFIGAGPTLGVLDGKFAFGVWGDVLFKASESLPLWVGGETGVLRASGDNSTLLSIPLMATALYQFDIPDWTVRPYAGASMGLSITRVSTDVPAINFMGYTTQATSVSDTSVYFELLGRAGVKYENFFFEARLGIIKDFFAFLPTAGYVFIF